MGLWSRKDWLIAAAMMCAGAAAGGLAVGAFARAGNTAEYYQEQFGPAVLFACGYGFVNPPEPEGASSAPMPLQPIDRPPPGFEALGEFLAQRRDSLDCSELPATFAPTVPRPFQAGHWYLMLLAVGVWAFAGISWAALNALAAMFAGATAGLVYLFARIGMGPPLAIAISFLWITSPLQLRQLPHLRDYAKAPFFMFTLCAVGWIALTRAPRGLTVAALAVTGAVLAIGFGVRTDVASYLAFVVLAVLAFRPGFDRTDLVTRVLAAGAAVVAFMLVGLPILRAYETGDNLAHVAMLGLSDPSRDWLRLREAPYSYGYLYHDGYLATVIAAYAERLTTLTGPVLLGTRDYAEWGNDYYGRLLATFTGDTVLRAWAAAIAVCQLSYEQLNLGRPAWISAGVNWIFDARAAALQALTILPPFAAVVLLAIGVGAHSVRLGGLFLLFAVIVPGMTSIQFQDRHVFHLEILSLAVYGCLLHQVWQLVRRRTSLESPAVRAFAFKAAVVALVLAGLAVVPVVAARQYQVGSVTSLLSAYDAADVTPVALDAAPAAADDDLLLATPFAITEDPPRYVDTNVLKVAVGGERCDADEVSLRFRYHAEPPFADLTRETVVPVPPAGSAPVRHVFPVYSLGRRSTIHDALRFVGVEVQPSHLPCIVAIDRFTNPARFPLLLETMLLPDWRQRPLYETLRDFESSAADWRTAHYSSPDGLQPGRRWLSRLEREGEAPTFRSPQVRQVGADGIAIRGRASSSAAYLLSWPYAARPKGSAFFVEGEVLDGGLTVGVQQDEKWVQQLNVFRPGRFRAVIRVDADGTYGAVLANLQLRGLYHRSTISRYGWLPPEP